MVCGLDHSGSQLLKCILEHMRQSNTKFKFNELTHDHE